VCGITPYDAGHMGHAFTYCSFDVLVRYLEDQGVQVTYVQNVTDVDDPLFARARRDGVGWEDLARREVAAFVRDMGSLGLRPPDVMPWVSEEIAGILTAVEGLEEAGYAYQSDAVYFDTSRYPGYGELSHLSRRSMLRKLRHEGLLGEAGPRHKRDALDFPLWQPSMSDEPAWPARFGPGRPGWHIECSAMAMRYLGEQVDVHGGGRDLAFSHHESERAQSESLTGCVPFARCWMHTGLVRYEGRKMSKSRGNLVNVRQALARAPAAALRLYLASHHYRRDWDFSWEGLERLNRLVASLRALLEGRGQSGEVARGEGRAPRRGVVESAGGGPPGGEGELVERFRERLDDDLDTAGAIRVLRAAVRQGDAEAARWMLGILAGPASLG
jgi:L-cysteine:1D-myo-inositol 2-amino-2-deoxy-alpha-D-glucopyranoside ligase